MDYNISYTIKLYYHSLALFIAPRVREQKLYICLAFTENKIYNVGPTIFQCLITAFSYVTTTSILFLYTDSVYVTEKSRCHLLRQLFNSLFTFFPNFQLSVFPACY